VQLPEPVDDLYLLATHSVQGPARTYIYIYVYVHVYVLYIYIYMYMYIMSCWRFPERNAFTLKRMLGISACSEKRRSTIKVFALSLYTTRCCRPIPWTSSPDSLLKTAADCGGFYYYRPTTFDPTMLLSHSYSTTHSSKACLQ